MSVAGLAVTPAGNPEIATATVPLKPFAATTRTLTGEPVAPATMVSDAGDTASEKSAALWIPQDVRARHKDMQHPCAIFITSGLGGHFEEIPMASAAEGLVGCRESDFQY
jgi:hypothetical protein